MNGVLCTEPKLFYKKSQKNLSLNNDNIRSPPSETHQIKSSPVERELRFDNSLGTIMEKMRKTSANQTSDLFMLHHPAHTSGLHDYMFPTLHQPFYGRSQPITSNYGTAEAKSTCDGKKSKSSALINYDALRIGTDRLPAGISPLQCFPHHHMDTELSNLKAASPMMMSQHYLELAMLVCNTFRGKMYPCPHCRYVTDRRNNLKRHVSTMHQTSEKVLECCGIHFKTKALLREHIMIFHHNGYSCSYCGRRFCRKALLKRHLSVHSGQRDYRCSSCDYATSHKSNLERHKRIHDRLQSFDDARLGLVKQVEENSHSRTINQSSSDEHNMEVENDDEIEVGNENTDVQTNHSEGKITATCKSEGVLEKSPMNEYNVGDESRKMKERTTENPGLPQKLSCLRACLSDGDYHRLEDKAPSREKCPIITQLPSSLKMARPWSCKMAFSPGRFTEELPDESRLGLDLSLSRKTVFDGKRLFAECNASQLEQ